MNLIRLEALIGKENIRKIKALNILVIGLGGVGGYAVESLVRSGIEKITLVDGDIIETSNLNRQIIALNNNIHKYKTKEFYKRIKKINKDVKITLINTVITKDNIDLLFMQNYDYIIDACDTTIVKAKLIKECKEKNIKLISCMGTAKRLDATKVEITTLDKVSGDPLAKKVRKELTEEEINDTIVVHSTEDPIKSEMLGSSAVVPGVAGLYITSYILNDAVSPIKTFLEEE